MSHEERSEALIEVLNDLEQSEISFVLVGGYAISQFETRFSTDLDLVIAIDFDTVESHLHRGDEEALQSQLSEAKEFVEEGGLDHRFKSLFGKSAASSEDIDTVVSFLERQLD